ncbi:MAG TPA: hypothetical protein VFA34_03550 [Actinomycetota bacterium]|jgi:hypothetical protein|nr:hypothetical protein [Actinomycetota bacterium]
MSAVDLTLLESFAIEEGNSPVKATADRTVRITVRPQTVRLRRDLSASASGRRWLLELDVAVRVPDPERMLVACQGFLVDTVDGEALGVVDEVEIGDDGQFALALIVASGWFGRRRFRVHAEQIEVLAPDERRLLVRKPAAGFVSLERRR